jgi:capsular exopolysaccharide synthesis family protein
MALASFLALVLGGGLLWLLGKFDDRFASSSELAADLPERVLGDVLDVHLTRPERPIGPEALSGQRFEFLESFRSIRSALWFMGENGSRPKTILVSSSLPEEGKSTVAVYLAATMAKAGSRVLLVDGDMRRAKLHRHFNVGSSPGLAEILSRELSANQAIVVSSLPNLAFLPAGAPGIEPGELVLSSQLHDFLEQVSPRYDHIILDSPPVLAADDAAALAPNVDGVLFVVRGAYTSARMVREALAILRQRHARVLGLVFNRAFSSPFEYHPYQRYRKEYRWEAA